MPKKSQINKYCDQWLSLVELELQVVYTGRRRLLLAYTNQCGHAKYYLVDMKVIDMVSIFVRHPKDL